MKSDVLFTTRRHVSQNISEWLSCNLFGRGHVSCHNAIQIVVGYTLPVTLFVTAASHYVIKTEPHPFSTTVGHLNVGSVGRLIPTMSRKMPGKGSYVILSSWRNSTHRAIPYQQQWLHNNNGAGSYNVAPRTTLPPKW